LSRKKKKAKKGGRPSSRVEKEKALGGGGPGGISVIRSTTLSSKRHCEGGGEKEGAPAQKKRPKKKKRISVPTKTQSQAQEALRPKRFRGEDVKERQAAKASTLKRATSKHEAYPCMSGSERGVFFGTQVEEKRSLSGKQASKTEAPRKSRKQRGHPRDKIGQKGGSIKGERS